MLQSTQSKHLLPLYAGNHDPTDYDAYPVQCYLNTLEGELACNFAEFLPIRAPP